MSAALLDRIADWNPQLFREIKGQFKPKNLIFVGSFSFIIQSIICFLSWLNHFQVIYESKNIERLNFLYKNDPKQAIDECSRTFYCLFNSPGNFTLNWEVLWQNFNQQVFLWLSLCLIPALFVGGVYMIVSNLSQEKQRGTLNFIRLSPQKSESILTGKILGVPILLYFGILLSLPLHLGTAYLAGISIGFLLYFYSFLIICSSLFYNVSILYVLMGGIYDWGASFLVFIVTPPSFYWVHCFIQLELQSSLAKLDGIGIDNFKWFSFPIGHSFFGVYSFFILSLSLLVVGTWHIINRQFRNPKATIISKGQSYLFLATFQVWFLGFLENLTVPRSEGQIMTGFIFIFLMVPLIFLSLIEALSPHRQMLQEWAKYFYRPNLNSLFINTKNPSKMISKSLLKDLIWGKKSPVIMAIFINLLITTTLWSLWIVTGPETISLIENSSQQFYKLHTVLCIILTANFILICALINHLTLMSKTSKPLSLWMGILASFVLLPLVFFFYFSISPHTNPVPWLFSMFPIISVFYASTMNICLAILVQWTVQALLGWQLIRQLQRAGESPSKALLGGKT